MSGNLFDIPPRPADGELVTDIAAGSGFRVERIVSWGDVTPNGSWYDQDHDEWVIVVQGEGTVEDERGGWTRLMPGDAMFLPAHLRHRVVHTSAMPPCIWLAVHGRPPAASV